jgi:hypothetical protein
MEATILVDYAIDVFSLEELAVYRLLDGPHISCTLGLQGLAKIQPLSFAEAEFEAITINKDSFSYLIALKSLKNVFVVVGYLGLEPPRLAYVNRDWPIHLQFSDEKVYQRQDKENFVTPSLDD